MLPSWQAVSDARRRAGSLPLRHPRRLGWLLLDTGVICFFAVLPFDLPLKYASLGMALAGALLGMVPIHRLPGFRWALVFTALVVGTDLAHPGPVRLGGGVCTWLAIYLVAAGMAAPGVRRWGIRLMTLSLAISIGLALVQLGIGYTTDVDLVRVAAWGRRWGRVGAWHSPVVFGNQMAAIALMLWASARRLGLTRDFVWEARILAACGVFLSLVRMAFLALFAGAGAWLLARLTTGRQQRWVLPALGALPVLLVAAGTLYYLRDPQRIHNLLQGRDGRLLIWGTGLAMLRDHWLLGTGSGPGFNFAFLAHHPTDRPVEFGLGYFNLHNTPLTLAVQHGIFTVLAWFVWLGALLLPLWRRRREVGEAWPLACALMAGLVVLASFDHFAGRTILHLPMYAALGLALGLAAEATDDGGTETGA